MEEREERTARMTFLMEPWLKKKLKEVTGSRKAGDLCYEAMIRKLNRQGHIRIEDGVPVPKEEES